MQLHNTIQKLSNFAISRAPKGNICFSFWGTSSSRPSTGGLCPWTPLTDLYRPDPLIFCIPLSISWIHHWWEVDRNKPNWKKLASGNHRRWASFKCNNKHCRYFAMISFGSPKSQTKQGSPTSIPMPLSTEITDTRRTRHKNSPASK